MSTKPTTVSEYIATIPKNARPKFGELRALVRSEIPQANEVLSYGIIGYKTDESRAKIFISGWKSHVAVYPIPQNESLRTKLKPYIKGKGTLSFPLDQPLPTEVLKAVINQLCK